MAAWTAQFSLIFLFSFHKKLNMCQFCTICDTPRKLTCVWMLKVNLLFIYHTARHMMIGIYSTLYSQMNLILKYIFVCVRFSFRFISILCVVNVCMYLILIPIKMCYADCVFLILITSLWNKHKTAFQQQIRTENGKIWMKKNENVRNEFKFGATQNNLICILSTTPNLIILFMYRDLIINIYEHKCYKLFYNNEWISFLHCLSCHSTTTKK